MYFVKITNKNKRTFGIVVDRIEYIPSKSTIVCTSKNVRYILHLCYFEEFVVIEQLTFRFIGHWSRSTGYRSYY